MWFKRRLHCISCTAKKSLLREADTIRLLINRMQKCQDVMRREKVEHLVITRIIKENRSEGKQREKIELEGRSVILMKVNYVCCMKETTACLLV